MECGSEVCNTHWRLMGDTLSSAHCAPFYILHRAHFTLCAALHTGVWWGHTELINPQLTSAHLPTIVPPCISWGTLSSGRTLVVGHYCKTMYCQKIVLNKIISNIISWETLSSGRKLLWHLNKMIRSQYNCGHNKRNTLNIMPGRNKRNLIFRYRRCQKV